MVGKQKKSLLKNPKKSEWDILFLVVRSAQKSLRQNLNRSCSREYLLRDVFYYKSYSKIICRELNYISNELYKIEKYSLVTEIEHILVKSISGKNRLMFNSHWERAKLILSPEITSFWDARFLSQKGPNLSLWTKENYIKLPRQRLLWGLKKIRRKIF